MPLRLIAVPARVPVVVRGKTLVPVVMKATVVRAARVAVHV
jgi:hypothetical protein